MHRTILVLYAILLTCWVAVVVPAAARADEAQHVCPDMSDHQAALDGAAKYYSDHKQPPSTPAPVAPASEETRQQSSDGVTGSLSDRGHWASSSDYGIGAYGAPSSPADRDVYSAQCQAREYETTGKFGFAVGVYGRILSARQVGNNVTAYRKFSAAHPTLQQILTTQQISRVVSQSQNQNEVVDESKPGVKEAEHDLKRAQLFESIFLRTTQPPPTLHTFELLVDNIQTSDNLQPRMKLPLLKYVMTGMDKYLQKSPSANLKEHVEQLQNDYKREVQCLTMSDQLNEMAAKLKAIGAYRQALKLYLRVLDIRQKNLGPNDADTISEYGDMADLLAAEGKQSEAQKMYERALDQFRKLPNPGRNYGTMLETYAQFLVTAKQQQKASQIYDEAKAFYQTNKFF